MNLNEEKMKAFAEEVKAIGRKGTTSMPTFRNATRFVWRAITHKTFLDLRGVAGPMVFPLETVEFTRLCIHQHLASLFMPAK